jgi:Uma2 family endonuclease
MTTMLRLPEQRVVLHNITWELYESLLSANRDSSAPRFTYDRGELEIVSPSMEHEDLAETAKLFVDVVAEEQRINVKGFGSMTIRLKHLERGFEADGCFYIEDLGRIRGKMELDFRVDPPPDLVIEVDLTSSSVDKLAIMAELRVPEVWHYDKGRWRILCLRGTEYIEEHSSAAFLFLTAETITHWIQESRTMEPLEWKHSLREWVRGQ